MRFYEADGDSSHSSVFLASVSLLDAAESSKFPSPRFPSYLKPPKSIDDVMPFARAAVRQTGGRTPLGLVEKRMAALIVTEVGADPMVCRRSSALTKSAA